MVKGKSPGACSCVRQVDNVSVFLERSGNGKNVASRSGPPGQKNTAAAPFPRLTLLLFLPNAQDSNHSWRALRDGQILVRLPGEV